MIEPIQNEIRAILVDDEIRAIQNLSHLIATYCSNIRIIDQSQDVPEAIAKINKLKPDVIFLDISMPQQTGFDLLNKLDFLPFVIFVTAHDQFALKAIKICAVDFILKPVNPNELVNAVNKISLLISLNKQMDGNYKEVLKNLDNYLHNTGNLKKICLPALNGGYEVLQTDEIVHLEGEENYTTFYLVNKVKIIVSKTLKEYEDILEGFGFVRIHKSSIINLNHLIKILKGENVRVLLTNNLELTVSRRRTPILIEKIKSHIGNE